MSLEENEQKVGGETCNDAADATSSAEVASEPAAEESAASKQRFDDAAYLRLMADFDNFRKRSAREKLEIADRANADTLERFLPVADNFDRALEKADENDPFVQGMKMVREQLREVFAKCDLEALTSLGEKFDPEKHNAIAYQQSTADEGVIIAETVKGYCHKGKVLRAANVVVSKGAK